MTIDARIVSIEDKKEQDVAIMKMLSMVQSYKHIKSFNLWRRINAGYNIPRRQPRSRFKDDFPDDPLLKIAGPKPFNRRRDSFTTYNEALCRFEQLVAKPPIVAAPFVPQAIKIAEMKKRVAERKAQQLGAMQKVGAAERKPAAPKK